jgi:hypothetical protein
MASATFIVTITDSDFDRLHNTSMPWGKHWAKQANRFDNEPLFTWKMAYWCEPNWLNILVCQQFLSARGYESQTVFDSATLEYVILTNYESEVWAND